MAEPQKRSDEPQSRLRSQEPANRPSEIEPPSQSRLKPEATSTAAKLLAQVETLQAELATTRAKLAELEVHVDIDALTNVFNRRGFERELKRTLVTCSGMEPRRR